MSKYEAFVGLIAMDDPALPIAALIVRRKPDMAPSVAVLASYVVLEEQRRRHEEWRARAGELGIKLPDGHFDITFEENERVAESAERERVRRTAPDGDVLTPSQSRLKKYGITHQEYLSMLRSQGGGCAICSARLEGGKQTHIDHCHSTNKVRGILCRRCNRAIGLLGDTSKGIGRAYRYLTEAERK